MLKIGIDLRPYDVANTGIGRYMKQIVKHFRDNRTFNYFIFGNVDPSKLNWPDANFIKTPTGDETYALQYMQLQSYIHDIDLIFSPFYLIPTKRNAKTVLTIHDVIPLQLPELYADLYTFPFFDREMRAVVGDMDCILVDSQVTKNDIMLHYGLPEEKIKVNYLSSDPVFFESSDSDSDILNQLNITKPYFLSVSTHEPEKNKNVSRVLKAYEAFRRNNKEQIQLILVGGYSWGRHSKLIELIEHSPYREDIIINSKFLSDEQLRGLYRNAVAFIFPSLYEGFGIPMLEAMASYCPVVTSNINVPLEISGGCASLCDPYDVDSILYAMQRVVYDTPFRNRIVSDGRKRAEEFTWDRTFQVIEETFFDLLQD